MAEENKVEYTKTTAEVDLEERLARDNEPVGGGGATLNPGHGDVEAGNLYLGTSPIYQNHANDTDAPLQAEEGVDRDLEERHLAAYDENSVVQKMREAGDDDDKLAKVADKLSDDELDRVSPVGGGTQPADGVGSPLTAEDPGTGGVVEAEDEDGETETGGAGSTNANPVNATPTPTPEAEDGNQAAAKKAAAKKTAEPNK